MDFSYFTQLVSEIKIGKKLPGAVYIHRDAVAYIPEPLMKFALIVAKALKIDDSSWNLFKFSKKEFKLSFLNYPEFYKDSYPVLTSAVTVDLKKLEHRVTSYLKSDNPPILHRKELFISPEHENYKLFCEITEEGERAGLYENTRTIGFKRTWEALITKKGFYLLNGRLIRSDSPKFLEDNSEEVERHKTAIVRQELSAPMKLLAKHGFLNGDYSLFDYGCGRGDDLHELQTQGIDALGWDPEFKPEADKFSSDIVNLGFVINVIEDRDERIEVLQEAWELSKELLIISVMLANDAHIAQFTPYKDGVITSRKTFQKYYSQSEIKAFIELTLDDNAIAMAPGIFVVFKNKDLEQRFQKNRYRRALDWGHRSTPRLPSSEDELRIVLAQNEDLFKHFWIKCLVLGRCPVNDEFAGSGKLKKIVGSHKKAFKLVKEFYSEEEFKVAEKMRKEDLIVYFAMSLFEKHRPYTKQSDEIKRDIKAFFGNYKVAKGLATELLFEIADRQKMEQECTLASAYLPKSKLEYEHEKVHALIFHKQYLGDLAPLLRVYVGAGLQLYGELEDIQLIKIHVTSGKLTLLGYEDFIGAQTPKLRERIKIKMAEQSIDFFDYLLHENSQVLPDKTVYI